MNRLRDTLRDPLFIRERYGIRSTQLAEEIAPAIQAALAQLDDLIVNQQEFQPERAERQFILAPNSYVEIVLMPALVARLRAQAPGIKLRMTPFGSDLAETGVISGTTAMVLGRIVDPPDNLVVKHLMDSGLACVVRADHPEVVESMSRTQYERLKHVNVVPPGRLPIADGTARKCAEPSRNAALDASECPYIKVKVERIENRSARMPGQPHPR